MAVSRSRREIYLMRFMERHASAMRRVLAGLAENGDGGREGARTPGLLVANEALSQLSYTPNACAFSF